MEQVVHDTLWQRHLLNVGRAKHRRALPEADAASRLLQLKEADAKLTSVKREYALVNALVQLEKSARLFPGFSEFKDRAAERLAAFRAAPNVPAREFPRLDGVDSVVAVSVEHFGLDQSFTLGGMFAQHDF